MPKLSDHAQSNEKENKGIWILWCGMRFKIARLGNDRYNALEAAHDARNREREERGEPKKPWEEFYKEVISEAILLGWEDVQREDGSEWVYTKEEGLKVLSDLRYRDLFNYISIQSAIRTNFLEAADAATEKK